MCGLREPRNACEPAEPSAGLRMVYVVNENGSAHPQKLPPKPQFLRSETQVRVIACFIGSPLSMNYVPRSCRDAVILASIVLTSPLLHAETPSLAADKAPPTEISLYQVAPEAGKPDEVKAALASADREIDRLERVNNARRGPPREEGRERIAELRKLRNEVGGKFSTAGWHSLVRAIFLAMETDRIAATKFDDASLWNLSHNPLFLEAGQATVNNLCAPCHLPTLQGHGAGTDAFGPDLTDTKWIHGGKPTEIYDFITHGAFNKGMPPWGTIIGAKKVAEVAAVVLSKHKPGEPIEQTNDPRPGSPQ
jgi:hypothetical protein